MVYYNNYQNHIKLEIYININAIEDKKIKKLISKYINLVFRMVIFWFLKHQTFVPQFLCKTKYIIIFKIVKKIF